MSSQFPRTDGKIQTTINMILYKMQNLQQTIHAFVPFLTCLTTKPIQGLLEKTDKILLELCFGNHQLNAYTEAH